MPASRCLVQTPIAARSGRWRRVLPLEAGEVIEEALRRELGFDLLERLWARNDLGDEEALALGVEAQHETRMPRR